MTRGAAAAVRTRVVSTIGRRHIAGPQVADALRVAAQEAAAGARLTLAPWAARGEDAATVLAGHRTAVAAVASAGLPASLSIKLPELRLDEGRFGALLDLASTHQVPIHLDSLRVDTAPRTFALLREVVVDHPDVGCTLTGRWSRSVADAEAVLTMGVRSVRVVKGQWADPADPDRDPAQGMLDVVDALRGGGAEVGVATHDEHVATVALDRLAGSSTACRLEQLYGYPRLDVAAVRARFGAGHLVYVPYGEAFLPYALSHAIRNPRVVGWVARDLLAGLGARRSPWVSSDEVTDR